MRSQADRVAIACARSAELRRALTHCKHGHPYDAANTYRRPDGHRACKACLRRRLHERRARIRARRKDERQAARTHRIQADARAAAVADVRRSMPSHDALDKRRTMTTLRTMNATKGDTPLTSVSVRLSQEDLDTLDRLAADDAGIVGRGEAPRHRRSAVLRGLIRAARDGLGKKAVRR